MRPRTAQDTATVAATSVRSITVMFTKLFRAITQRASGLRLAMLGLMALAAASLAAAGAATPVRPAQRSNAHRNGPRNQVAIALSKPGAAVHAHAVLWKQALGAWRAAHPAPSTSAAAPASTPAAAPTSTTTTTSPPPPPPAATLAESAPPPVTDATSTTTSDWACIRLHESGDRWNTPAVPGGAYGFLESTWLSLGYSGWPYEASPAVQSHAALYLYNELGWQPWSTRFVCGL